MPKKKDSTKHWYGLLDTYIRDKHIKHTITGSNYSATLKIMCIYNSSDYSEDARPGYTNYVNSIKERYTNLF